MSTHRHIMKKVYFIKSQWIWDKKDNWSSSLVISINGLVFHHEKKKVRRKKKKVCKKKVFVKDSMSKGKKMLFLFILFRNNENSQKMSLEIMKRCL